MPLFGENKNKQKKANNSQKKQEADAPKGNLAAAAKEYKKERDTADKATGDAKDAETARRTNSHTMTDIYNDVRQSSDR